MNQESAEKQIEELQCALKKKTEQWEATRLELEQFAYSISHDLRAPLRAIEGFSKILAEDYPDKIDEEGKRYLNILDFSSRKLTRMLDDILQFSRLGRQEMKLSSVNMNELATSVWQELHRETAHRKIDFKLNPLPDCWGDATLLHRVWANLIGNAIKFTALKENAVIEINAKTEADRMLYSVKDNGAGFNMPSATKLFGVFQRLHSDEHFKGNGMGLAIAQRLVRRHSGEIWADAKKEEGATFYFALPRVEKAG